VNNKNTLNYVIFPPVSNSEEDGLLAGGGDLKVDTLISAYAQGIFPWFNDDQPILWWSPDPRMVLYPENVKVSRSLRKIIRQQSFTVKCNHQFKNVITQCALRGASDDEKSTQDTWITQSMHDAYNTLHKEGFAHSIEVYQEDTLVGGLYGLALGNVFFGESMFSLVSNASKIALVALCKQLRGMGINMIDCQVASDHLYSMGAKEISRDEFINHLDKINKQLQNRNASGLYQHFPDEISLIND